MASKHTHQETSQVFERHSALVFDLCEYVLWDINHAQQTFLWVSKRISKTRNRYQEHERSWVLQIVCDRILAVDRKHALQLTASEQIELDSAANPSSRMGRFNYYFHRLSTEQRLVLALRDRHQVSYGEMAAAMRTPVASLKILRQQALRTLEEWIWDDQ